MLCGTETHSLYNISLSSSLPLSFPPSILLFLSPFSLTPSLFLSLSPPSVLLFLSLLSLSPYLSPSLSLWQAAAEYVKTHLPDVLRQHLQAYEKEKENSVLNYQTILEKQILSLDKEMIDKLSEKYDEAGESPEHRSQNR